MEIKTKKELRFVIRADRMMNIGRFNIPIKERLRFFISPNLILSYLERMRKCSYYSFKSHGGGGKFVLFTRILFLYNYLKYKKLSVKLGFSIGYNTLGYGVLIPHYGTIVIGKSNRIGKYAVIHTCTCISDNQKVIGDALYLSVGAKVTAKISLGNNITIGANSLVNKSFKENGVLVAGIPAVIIKPEESWYVRDGFVDRIEKIESLRAEMHL